MSKLPEKELQAPRYDTLRKLLNQQKDEETIGTGDLTKADLNESYYSFDHFSRYEEIRLHRLAGMHHNMPSPFFLTHDGCAGSMTSIDGKQAINFGTYNYLGLNGHEEINETVKAAIDRYGISASASRLVAGERPPHQSLERSLAKLYGTDDALVFVSGHATNVSLVSTLFGAKDLVVHDQLIHNSIKQGALLSGAVRQSFKHNDWHELDLLLNRSRHRFEKVLICIEGVYSMDGDIPELDRFVAVARKHKSILMVDEAHALGVLGKTGRGLAEHFDIDPNDVDIWMGTLSKTLGGCGGYVAGSSALIDMLRYSAPGFVYSVGLPPALAVGVEKAIDLMIAEPDRVERLNRNGRLFLKLSREAGLDTGRSQGFNIIPVITGGSLPAVRLSHQMLERNIVVTPVIYPAVEENAARLRFFLSSEHNDEQIKYTVSTLQDLVMN